MTWGHFTWPNDPNSARAVGAPDNASWSDLGHWEDNAEEYLYRRLRWFEHQGYPMAMLWCVAPPSDRRSTFLPAQEEQVLRFAHRSGTGAVVHAGRDREQEDREPQKQAEQDVPKS